MLIYHPAFDVNHARLRLIQLLEFALAQELSFDLLRILDFYFLFPHLLAEVKLTRGMSRLKKELAARANNYNRVPSPRTLLRQMAGVQETAIRALEAFRLIELPLAGVSVVKRSSAPLPEGLIRVISEQPEEERALAQALATEVAKIPLNGPDGLKARTGLLEYRYDPA